jgi:uncharacterized RDD family membrane protein YckC
MNRNPYTPPAAPVKDVGEWRPLPGAIALLDREDFGGFWLRLLALSVDGLLMSPLLTAISYALKVARPALSQTEIAVLDITTSQVAWAIYDIGFWASSWQATPGKRLCGLVVTSDRLERVSLARATLRYFATGLSAITIIGVLTVAASERRRALHDMLARTLVVKRRALRRVAAESHLPQRNESVVPAA